MKKKCLCTCGENNPDNFYIVRSRTKCKLCISIKNKSTYKTWSIEQKEEYSSKQRIWQQANLIHYRVLSAKHRLLKKGMEFTITDKDVEDILKEQNNKCFYTHIEFNNDSDRHSISIDRIDSLKGYNKNNIRLVCSMVNFMKAEYSEKEFLDTVKLILNNFN